MPVTEDAIRASFVNCTKGEAKRLAVPKDLDERPWADLDFLGWRDPSALQRAYLVTEAGPGLPGELLGDLLGVALRVAPPSGQKRRGMCSFCLTTHPGDGISLMSARKAGAEGRLGNTVGVYVCTDLACSLYLRGRKNAGQYLEETITLEDKIERARTALGSFLNQVVA